MSRPDRLARLDALPPATRLALAALGHQLPVAGARLGFGIGRLDDLALPVAALHEIGAETADDAPAAAAFALLLALRADRPGPIVWLVEDRARHDGRLHGQGLAELGCDPDRLLLVRAPDTLALLRAGHDAVQCGAIGAAILAPFGAAKAIDLTVTRRLAMAAARSGVPALLLRSGEAVPTAAFSRWRVAAAPSVALPAGAPGRATFALRLDRHRGGVPGFDMQVEWDRDRGVFAPLSGGAPALAPRRAGSEGSRAAGRAGGSAARRAA